ncbi:MAG: diacylglycerol kinase family lipid kinase [Bacteroidales bacterium]|nr:diacylglycerol kinase family lipid kinase [Bacteroidales bacterium]
MEKTKRNICFIINPVSGVRRKDMLGQYIQHHLDQDQYKPDIQYTKKPGDATTLAEAAVRDNFDIVVAAGGDGTINEVSRALTGTKTTLGVIPLGSGNGLAHHLKIPNNPVSAIQLINKGKEKMIDTVNVNNTMYVSIAGIAFVAKVAGKFARSDKRGFLSYFRIVSQEYTFYKEKKYSFTIDGKTYKRKALLISFANSNQFGYHTTIAPGAKLDDGLIDVCIVKKVPLIELPVVAHLLYWNQIDKSRHVEIIRAKEVLLEQKKNRNINLDGEPVKLGKKLHFKINPLSLKILIP